MAILPTNRVVLIDRDEFTLKLMKRSLTSTKFDVEKVYPIAVGDIGYATPRGLYEVRTKSNAPEWRMPYSDWVDKELQGTVVPAGHPDNPIVARWIGVHDDEGVGIHGTSSLSSIGTRASHGCIRMYAKDVIELFDKVRKGTLVHIT